ncbi:MAG: type II secretion system protein [Candidatus Parcubacteria bacterium]|nr:type II secretion system protein [Candidatus Parcubacteria bacterium]
MIGYSLNKEKREKGMTLVEILIVMAVIGILLAVSFSSYRPGGQELALQRSAFKVLADIENAREMAMSALKYSSGSVPIGGYGVYFNTANPTNYILFADLDASRDRKSDGSEDVKSINMETGIILKTLLPSSPVNIIFVPPAPNIFLQGGIIVGQIDITIAIQGDLDKTKIISVNKAGLISAN